MHKRRIEIIKHLGGKCKKCGATDNLNIDHIKSKEKTFPIARNYNRRWEVLLEELKKCQLLCVPCHKIKTKLNKEMPGNPRGWKHGSLTGYIDHKCRCKKCIKAKAKYHKEWSKKKNKK